MAFIRLLGVVAVVKSKYWYRGEGGNLEQVLTAS